VTSAGHAADAAAPACSTKTAESPAGYVEACATEGLPSAT
jgi:hypothetical protein